MKRINSVLLACLVLLISACSTETEHLEPNNTSTIWRFAVVGDTHVTTNSDTIAEMIPFFLKDNIDLILVCGDLVDGGKKTTSKELETELEMWQAIFQPVYDAGIDIYPVRGNHEDDAGNNIAVWNRSFSGDKALPQNGPSGETNLTYAFQHKNATFIGLDTYVNIHKINQAWLDEQLAANTQPHIFVFGHEAAFKVFHADCLGAFPTDRDLFWKSLSEAGVKTYFCGHDHFFDAIEVEDLDDPQANEVYQCLVGGGGGWLMPKYNYNGDNSIYTITPLYHREAHGYALVEISGDQSDDLAVTITWKERLVEGSKVSYVATSNIIRYQVSKTDQ